MSLSTLFPAAFPALVLAHFVALLSPGQDFFLIVSYSIRHQLKGSRFICVGVALGNAFYIGIAIFGWTSIRNNSLLFSLVELLGAIYLLWLGVSLLRSRARTSQFGKEKAIIPSALNQLILGLNSALLNPKNALFYMSLLTVILGNNVTTTQQISSGVWMFLAVLLWDFFIAATISQSCIQNFLNSYVHIIERFSGVIFIIFGSTIIISHIH
ncbi:LysE family translocator [Shewanella algae]|uniref:LysE family translocator n=1 Tax=Shewanella algae TaxID=38313 RepID=UPI0031F5CC5F